MKPAISLLVKLHGFMKLGPELELGRRLTRTADRKSRGAGDKLQELSLLVDVVGAEDLVEVVHGRRLTRVAVIRTTTLVQHPHRPPLKATAAEQLLQLVADTGTSDYLM